MLVLTLIVAAFAVARLARLVAEDTITIGFRRKIVNRFGPDAWITKLIHCAPWCMSMWFAAIMPVVVLWPTLWLLAVLSIPAGSMAAAVILRTTDRE